MWANGKWVEEVLEEIRRRLNNNETVYVWYHNADNDWLSPLYEYNALKLVPTQSPHYDRFWWSQNGWVQQYIDDHNADSRHMNPNVHLEIIEDEETAHVKVLEWLKEAPNRGMIPD